jgi:hypothetical protein
MSSAATLSKLGELRAKTDQQLAGVIDNELERGLRLARMAAGADSNLECQEAPHLSAEKIFTEARKLLSKVDDPGERRRLEKKLEQLRETLAGPSAQELRVQTAYC